MPAVENTFPSRANLTIYKNKIKSATHGLSLIKRKRDAIDVEMRSLEEKVRLLGPRIEDHMREALMTLLHGQKLLGADLRTLLVSPDDSATAVCYFTKKRIMGTSFETVNLDINDSYNLDLVGLGTGGVKVQEARLKFQDICALLIEAGSMRMALQALGKARREVSTRVNAIEYVIIPRLKNTQRYIENELEEREREEFFRMKRSKQTKARTDHNAEQPPAKPSLSTSSMLPWMLLCSCKSAPGEPGKPGCECDPNQVTSKGRQMQGSIQNCQCPPQIPIRQPADMQPNKISCFCPTTLPYVNPINQGQLQSPCACPSKAQPVNLVTSPTTTQPINSSAPDAVEDPHRPRRAKKRTNKKPSEKSMQTEDEH